MSAPGTSAQAPHDAAGSASAQASRSAPGRPLVATALVGVVLVVAADLIVNALAWVMPVQFELRSSGVPFPSFLEVGPEIIRRSGLVLIISSAGAALVSWRRVHVPSAVQRGLPVLLVLATGLWYAWLGTPHNASRFNARIHWVDRTTWESDDWLYAASKIPHTVFYEAPWMWNGLIAAITTALLYRVGRQMSLSRLTACGMATAIPISGNILLVADTAEGVMLNLALILVVVFAHLARRPILLGVALGAVVLGRPSFAVMIPATLAGELVASWRRGRLRRREPWRFAIVTAGTATLMIVLEQIVFTILGDRYLFVNGKIFDSRGLAELVTREVDGFTLYSFSGTFVSHLIWAFPPLLILGSVAAVVVARRRPLTIEAPVYAAAMTIALIVLIHEVQPYFWYTIRYLTYAIVLLVFMAWSLLVPAESSPTTDPLEDGREQQHSAPMIRRALLTVALLLAPATIPAHPIADRRDRIESPTNQLLESRHELRELLGDETINLVLPDGARNVLSYVIKDDLNRIRLLSRQSYSGDGFLIVQRGPWFDGVASVYETEDFLVFRAEDVSPYLLDLTSCVRRGTCT